MCAESAFLGLFSIRLKAAGVTCKSSIGSTPSCSHPVKEMAQLSEVHPGNYVFYGDVLLSFCKFVFVFKSMYGDKHHQWFLLLCFRCATVSDWLLHSRWCGCEGFVTGHRTLSSQEPAPDWLWLVWAQVYWSVFYYFTLFCIWRMEPLTRLC